MKEEQLVQLNIADLDKNHAKFKAIIIAGAVACLLFVLTVLYMYYLDPNQWSLLYPSLSLCGLPFYRL